MTYTAAMFRYQIASAVSDKKLDWLTETLAATPRIANRAAIAEAITERRAKIARGCIAAGVCRNHPEEAHS